MFEGIRVGLGDLSVGRGGGDDGDGRVAGHVGGVVLLGGSGFEVEVDQVKPGGS